jgi:hypothetical protein
MRLSAALAQVRRDDRSEVVHQAAYCLVRNDNSSLGEQILDMAKAKREPEIKPDRMMDALRREPISGVTYFLMLSGYAAFNGPGKLRGDVTLPFRWLALKVQNARNHRMPARIDV